MENHNSPPRSSRHRQNNNHQEANNSNHHNSPPRSRRRSRNRQETNISNHQENNISNHQENNNINHENNNNNNNEEDIMQNQPQEDLHQPPITFICITDNPRPNILPPPRSIRLVFQVPRVPLIVNRRFYPGGPNVAVSYGVIPLSHCNNYQDFLAELINSLELIFGEILGGDLSFRNLIPGHDLWYEMMGPVERRVAFVSHPWHVFKSRVRVVVLHKI